MRLTRRILLACGATLSVLVAGAAPAAADVPVEQVGWWTRSPTPPSVPEGGISVAAAPDGDLSVAAVVVDAGGGVSGGELRLVEISGGNPLAALQVCPGDATWSPAAGGDLADAPEGDCESASAPLVRGDDGTWTADVQPLLDGRAGRAGLVIRPGEGSIAFQLTFAPPRVAGSVAASPPTTATTASPAATTGQGNVTAPAFVAPAAPAPSSPVTVAAAAETETAAPVAAAAEEVPFTPQLAVRPIGDRGRDIGAGTVLAWYLLAMIVGAVVAGVVWLRNADQLSLAAILARLRR